MTPKPYLPRMASNKKPHDYKHYLAAQLNRKNAAHAFGRDIGPIPEITNPIRRDECKHNLEKFCLTYFPDRFYLPFSDDHRAVIKTLERVILKGGRYALAMPRGYGKTTLCILACLWALLYGHRRFVILVGATEEKATRQLFRGILVPLQNNELLLADFPETCFPIHALKNIQRKTTGQTSEGKPTNIIWGEGRFGFPSTAGAAAGSSVICCGITGAGLKGPQITLPDGTSIRPDLVLFDDPATDEVANSPMQTMDRLDIMARAVLGLAGPGKSVASFATVTCIEKHDLADKLLDRTLFPDWQGTRFKRLNAMPTNTKLWEEYQDIRSQNLKSNGNADAATEFYRQHKEEMDEGAEASWPEDHLPHELSAIQHAMNIKAENEAVFWAEHQNDPRDFNTNIEELPQLTRSYIQGRLSHTDRYAVPKNHNLITTAIDVGSGVLWYATTAWDDYFNGTIIDYGSWPQQRLELFSSTNAAIKLVDLYGNLAKEPLVVAGLTDLTNKILRRTYDDMHVKCCLVDSSYLSPTIYDFAGQFKDDHTFLFPAHGQTSAGMGTSVDEMKVVKGEVAGLGWRRRPIAGRKQYRVTFDPNLWKSFVAERLLARVGTPGALTLYGSDRQAHQMIGNHFTCERRIREVGKSKDCEVWLSGKVDNHLWDCTVMAAVAASVSGLKWNADAAYRHRMMTTRTNKQNQPSKSWRELYDEARQRENVRSKI